MHFFSNQNSSKGNHHILEFLIHHIRRLRRFRVVACEFSELFIVWYMEPLEGILGIIYPPTTISLLKNYVKPHGKFKLYLHFESALVPNACIIKIYKNVRFPYRKSHFLFHYFSIICPLCHSHHFKSKQLVNSKHSTVNWCV